MKGIARETKRVRRTRKEKNPHTKVLIVRARSSNLDKVGATPAIRILLTKAYRHRHRRHHCCPCLLLLGLALLVVLDHLVDLGLALLVVLGLNLRIVLKSILTVKITKWNLHLLVKSITVACMTITAIMTKYRMVYPSQQLYKASSGSMPSSNRSVDLCGFDPRVNQSDDLEGPGGDGYPFGLGEGRGGSHVQGQGHPGLPSAGDTGEPGGLGIPGGPGVVFLMPHHSRVDLIRVRLLCCSSICNQW
mmetsp:Transcript_32069/g.46602  ORF Transcript_32069/g.46602 Transcript_32069/m.46602 type:complete len:247 (+) Transcript_32069:316-1056(+)